MVGRKDQSRIAYAIEVSPREHECYIGFRVVADADLTPPATKPDPVAEMDRAVLAADFIMVKALLKGNPELANSKDSHGNTPLLIVAGQPSDTTEDTVKALLESKADVNAKDESGRTSLEIIANWPNPPTTHVVAHMGYGLQGSAEQVTEEDPLAGSTIPLAASLLDRCWC